MAEVDFTHLRQNPFWRKKFAKAFEFIDVDKDGYLSRADLELIVTKYKALPGIDSAHAEAFARAMDDMIKMYGLERYSRKVTCEEHMDTVVDQMAPVFAAKLEVKYLGSIFDTIDSNSDGWIDLAEWSAHYECHGIPVKHAKASFDAIDTNHDNLLSRKEFLDYHVEFFCSSEDKLRSSILYGPLD